MYLALSKNINHFQILIIMAQQNPKGDVIRTTISLKLSTEQLKKLKDIADKKERSVSFIVSKMTEEALEKIK